MMKRLTQAEADDALDMLATAEEAGDPRATVLLSAALCVLQDRNSSYGEPEDCFRGIADIARYMPATNAPDPVGVAMVHLATKLQRLRNNNGRHWDSYVDAIGYLACAAQVVQVEVEEELEEELGSAAEECPCDYCGDAECDQDCPATEEECIPGPMGIPKSWDDTVEEAKALIREKARREREEMLQAAQRQHFQAAPLVVGQNAPLACCHKTVAVRCPGCPYSTKGLDAYRG